ncbi:MAG: 4Fe-4S dicluster domain-containing protein [Trueperaceae bacterium]|nr:MAG: 4Fe-4S dicluster domain-containing protein [Trueperaceae bacterium]
MQHSIPTDDLGPEGKVMAEAVEACVHCGFCLPTCPTYRLLGEEMNSPRGRIILMKEALEGSLSLEEVTPYLDPCLGCMACVTACPSGVQYGELLTPFRMQAEATRRRPLGTTLLRRVMLATLPFPSRFRAAAMLGLLVKPLRPLLGGRLGEMLDLLPRSIPRSAALPRHVPAIGERRARVALLAGCAQQVLAPDINEATLRVLANNGVEVLVPPEQSCCGALAAHTGESRQAKSFARNNLKAFPKDVDAIVTNAAGCGSGMQEYGLWLLGDSEEGAARNLASRVKDVSVFLTELGLKSPDPFNKPIKVAYHDACHLAHAQGVTVQPRQLLSAMEGLELVELPESELCCGSAGSYNIEQPKLAGELGERKAEIVRNSGAELVVTGNIGCLMQLKKHLGQGERGLPVLHTVQLLDRAYRNEL